MGAFAAPVVLVRVLVATARLMLAVARRYPGWAIAVLIAFSLASGGKGW